MSNSLANARWPVGARWLRRSRSFLKLAGCFSLVLTASVFVDIENGANQVWVANGVLLAYLLLAPRWRWIPYLCTGFIAQIAEGMIMHPYRWRTTVALAVLNLLEVAIAAFLVRRKATDLPQFTSLPYLLRFIGYAVLVAPAISGTLFAIAFSIVERRSPWQALLAWMLTDSLGIAITAPACVAVFLPRLNNHVNWKTHWPCPLLLVAATLGAFSQSRIPLLFLLYPLVAMVLFRFGLGWAAMASLFIAAAGSLFTQLGLGPFAHQASFTAIGATWLLQLYVASGVFMVFAASSVMNNLRQTERKLQKIAALHSLVTENSRDAILIVDPSGYPIYASVALKKLTGWRPGDATSLGFVEMVHPDDIERVTQVVRELRPGADSATVTHRIRKRDGDFVWIEGSLRLVIDPVSHRPTGILAILRDISERKAAEQALRGAYDALEKLAVTDPLTRIANRRRLDQCLASEWRRSIRNRQPLSFLLLDVDLFKSYNDTYGHLRGDTCLKTISEIAQRMASRPGDLAARFGGEEFAVILPNTTNAGALEVAEQIRAAVFSRGIIHGGSPLGYLTVSVGCATALPVPGQIPTNLLQSADEALYLAKRTGRNHVSNANAADSTDLETRVG